MTVPACHQGDPMQEELSNSGDVRPIPDPTRQTTAQIFRGIENLEKLTEALQSGDVRVIEAKIAGFRREIAIMEAHRIESKADLAQHRLELKAGDEKALSTAMIAAEKAVQAALAAAEKARDQQTIASQLATTKAEQASKEQMEQQGATFTLAISGLTTGVNDLKGLVGEIRTEKKVAADTTTERRSTSSQTIAIVAVAAVLFSGGLGAIVVILVKLFGG